MMVSTADLRFYAICAILMALLSFAENTTARSSSLISRSQHRHKRDYDCRNKPAALRFQCASGNCIDVDRLCDGVFDCFDHSDESAVQCSHNAPCPGLSFRCKYGACIDSDARCNDIRDCFDGSDEVGCGSSHNSAQHSNRPMRPALGLSNGTPSRTCRSDEFRCGDGQCVDTTVVCDGPRDCSDGSDETPTQCYGITCPSYSFRCEYGGCIDNAGRCDNQAQCADGSDENAEMCRGFAAQQGSSGSVNTSRPTSRPTQRPWSSTQPTQRPTTSSRPQPAQPSGGGCRLPENPADGSYTVNGCSSGDYSALCRRTPGTSAPHSTSLSYTCRPGYQLVSENNVNFTFCLDGHWTPEPPQCARTCPALISNSVDLECTTRRGTPVACDKGQLPGTRATLHCKPSYRFPAGVTPDYDAVNCQADGTWDWPLFKCIPECGVAVGKGQTLIVNGNDAPIGDFPWHTGIYDTQQKAGITQVCGGSLVLPNLVVSAAHCYYDDVREVEVSPSRYKVAVGKYYRDWNAEERGVVQRSDVEKIYLPPKYRGRSRNYADDIALLELKIRVTVSAVVMPICVDWLGETLPSLRRGDVGTVVGWGRTGDRTPSSTLQSARLPFVPFDDCLNGIPETFRPYITSDKFCAGSVNGSAVAKGDSGGGLAFKDKSAWFLRGVVSAGVPNTLTYSAFTNVKSFKDWMSQIRSEVENRGSLGSHQNG